MEDQFIGNYKVLKKIGSGGSAKVYLGVHRDVPNLKVILKILSDPRLIERFKQEADKLALLDGHPNICRIKHFFKHGDDTVIAMEYIDGMAFDERIKSDGKLTIDEALKVSIDVLDILEFAHKKGIYHRDIKPSNIMIDKSGQVKIIDFGIAKGESDQNLTIAGTACGTPAYMAPEQFTPTDDTNYALVDVYAAGTTLFHMLTGELPFKGDNEFAIRDAKIFNEPVKPRSVASGIPQKLEDIILKCLAKEPESRYQSVAELRKALQDIHKQDSGKQEITREVAAKPSKLPKPSKPGKKLPLGMIGGIAVAVVIIAFVVYKFVLPIGGGEPSAPGKVRLDIPVEGERVTESSQPSMKWEETAGEGGSYILEYATDSTFAGSRTIAGLTSGSYTFAAPLENGTYFWRIYPMNASGVRGEKSDYSSFILEVAAPFIPKGRLAITVRPSGDIYVGGELVERNKSQASLDLDTGTHAVQIRNSRSREKTINDDVRIDANSTVTRSYAFSFPPAAPKERFGEVRVGSKPRGASISIDGEIQRQKTNYTFSLKPGRHIIEGILAVGDETVRRSDTLDVVADSTHKVIFDFEQ